MEPQVEKKVDFRTLPIYEKFPYEVEGIENRTYVTKEDENLAYLADSGEMIAFKPIAKTKSIRHDTFSYTKFFHGSSQELINLSVPAANMLFLIMNRLEPNAKYVHITEEDFLEFGDYKATSKRLYYAAVLELIERDVIRKRAGYARCYWINPNMIFNGDRTKI